MNFRSIFIVTISLLSVLATVSIFSPYLGLIPVHAATTITASPNPLTVELGSNTFSSTLSVSGFTGSVGLAAIASVAAPPPASVVFSLDSASVPSPGTAHLIVSDSDFTTTIPSNGVVGDVNVTATPSGATAPTNFVLVSIKITILAGRAQIVLQCESLIPKLSNCNSPSILPFESIVYDTNNNGIFDAGDSVIAGPLPPVGTHLAYDTNIRWRDASIACATLANCKFVSTDPVFYLCVTVSSVCATVNNTLSGRVFLANSPTLLATQIHVTGLTPVCISTNLATCTDLHIKFAQTDQCGTTACTTLQGIVQVKAKLVNIGGILADGSEQDVMAQQVIYTFDKTVLQASCTTPACGATYPGQFDAFCITSNPTACTAPIAGHYTYTVDSYCSASTGSGLDTISADNLNGKISSSMLCSQGPPSLFDTGLGCDPNYIDPANPNHATECPGAYQGPPIAAPGSPNPPLLNVTSMVVQFFVQGFSSGFTIQNVLTAPGVSGSSLTDIDGTTSTSIPVVLGSAAFSNAAIHSSTTSVSCLPSSVANNTATTCTATVTDSATTNAVSPSGSVSFTSSGTGSFDSTTCGLAAGASTGASTCSVKYTPTRIGTGTHTITAVYVGDGSHSTSQNTFQVTVTAGAHPSSTAVNCVPGSVPTGAGTVCTATVTDTSAAGVTTPTGTVGFASDGAGGFTPGTSCVLSAGTTAGTATCQVTYTPTAVGTGTHTITGTYVPTSAHSASHGTFAVTVTAAAHPTITAVICVPASVPTGTGTLCAATVTDTSSTGATTPTGSVGFASDGAGAFTPGTSCTLSAGTTAGTATCQVTYTPSAVGTGTHTITGTYAPTSNHVASHGTLAVTVTQPAAHPTSTTVSCAPNSVTTGMGTVCTATVTDTSTTGATTPTGTVDFTSDGAGAFTPGTSCTLSASTTAGTATCHVTYTPSAVGTGTHTITGTFAPTSNHAASHGTFALTVTPPPPHPTTTAINCIPASVTTGTGTVCTATVTDTSTTGASTPTGTVGFASDGAGSFTPGTSCALSAGTTAGTATCQVTYTPSAVGTGTHTITGTYAPTSNHAASHGNFALTVTAPTAHPTSTSVNCAPNSVAVNVGTLCTATVTDTSTTGATTPTGSVSFASSGTGTFTPGTSCNLSAGTVAGTATCQVTYTPTVVGTGSHTVTGTYVPTSNHAASHGTFAVTVTPPPAHPTTTAVNCVPASVNTGVGTVCTATVTDTSSSGAITPMGTVGFVSDGAGGFTPSATCTLAAGTIAGTASCQATYTPTAVGTGTHTITGTFAPTSNHLASHGTFAVTVTAPTAHPTSTSVNCVPGSVTVNSGTLCTATVTDTSSTGATTPTGNVGFTTDGTGSFTPSASCTLAAGTTASTATCHVTYTPTVVGTGTHSISGTYSPTSNHVASHGAFALTVTAPVAHPTTTSVNCSPASVTVSTGSTCTAIVTDTSSTAASRPTGSVSFTSDGAGTFTPSASCTLAAGTIAGTATCQVTYTPTAVGSGTHTITGTYAPTSNHVASHGTFIVTVIPPAAHPTATAVNCVPASVTVNSGTTCTATVTDTSGTGANTPTGSVGFTTDGAGTFTPSTSCTLAAGTTAGTATCHVTYTPTLVGTGTHTVTGTFVPTSNHAASHGAFAVTVTPPTGETVQLTFSAFDLDDFDNGVGQFQVLVNGHLVVDIPAGLNHLSGSGDYAPYTNRWVKFGPFDITSFVIQGQNTIVFRNPLTSHDGLVRNVTITQGSMILLNVVRASSVESGEPTTYTFSIPPLRIASFTGQSSPNSGLTVMFTATYTGGTGPFRCVFRFGDDQSAVVSGSSSSCSATHSYDDEGTFRVSVRVIGNSTSDVQTARLTITIQEGSTASVALTTHPGLLTTGADDEDFTDL